MALFTTPVLEWRPDGAPTRLVAEIDGDDDYLVIDHDESRRGGCKWFLTWYTTDNHEGVVLQSDVDPDGLKSYAKTWVGDDE